MTKPEPLWNDDESWTNEAIRMDTRFRQIVEDFIKQYPEHKLREMEMLLIACVTTTTLGMILDRRFSKAQAAGKPVLIKDDCCGLEDMGEQD